MSIPALRSSRLSFVLSSITFLVVAVIAVPMFADSHARIVRLSYIDGEIELDKADGHGFSTAYENMPVAYQYKLWARDGEAEVELEDGSSIRLTPDTLLAFTDLSLDSSGQRHTLIELLQGTAYFDVRSHNTDNFEVQFGHNRARLVTSARFRVDADKGNYELATITGEVQVSNGSVSEVVVKKDETIRLDSDDADRYYLSKGIDAETYDGWDNERAKSHDEAVTAAASSGYEGMTYGLSDLAAYGNYFYVPGYGYMWRPGSASLGWDPFADGYWVQYPGFGYTFVSAYPWGWAPYRYGSWQFVNGYGWCWHPGSNWNTWNTTPAILSVPPHFHPPERPKHGPQVVVVTHGVGSPAPSHPMVVDNDSLDWRRPHSGKIVNADGEVLHRGPGVTSAAAAGFVGTTSGTASGVTTAPPSRPIMPRNGWRQTDGGNTRVDSDLNRRNPGTSSHAAGAPAAETRTGSPGASVSGPAWRPGPAPVAQSAQSPHSDVHVPSPRMESHVSNSAPAMHSAPAVHTESHSGGWSSGASMHSAPSASMGGGGHMGGGAVSSGGVGGSHSSGGSHR